MKFDYKSYSNHLESENERLNTIIDEIEEINEDQLTEIFMLNLKIKKVIDFIDNWKKYKKGKGNLEVSMLDLLYIKEILGADDNEET